jgi:hypothetical protein
MSETHVLLRFVYARHAWSVTQPVLFLIWIWDGGTRRKSGGNKNKYWQAGAVCKRIDLASVNFKKKYNDQQCCSTTELNIFFVMLPTPDQAKKERKKGKKGGEAEQANSRASKIPAAPNQTLRSCLPQGKSPVPSRAFFGTRPLLAQFVPSPFSQISSLGADRTGQGEMLITEL